MTSKEIAIAFFRHMISEVIGGRDEVFKIYMNISDRWPNRNVQELMLNLKSVRTDAQFEHVDECLSSIIGRMRVLFSLDHCLIAMKMKMSDVYLQCQDQRGRLGGVAGSVVLYVI
jgi:hypothetical protein